MSTRPASTRNFGPDYEGQMRRLRSSDGVYFTKSGARKLAHYVEREIRRYMNNRVVPVALPSGPIAPAPPDGKPAARPLAGPVVPLTVTPGNSDELLGGAGTRPAHGDAIATRVLVKGEPVPAPRRTRRRFRLAAAATASRAAAVGRGTAAPVPAAACGRSTRARTGADAESNSRAQESTPRQRKTTKALRQRRKPEAERSRNRSNATPRPPRADRPSSAASAIGFAGQVAASRQRGSVVDPIRNLSTACAAWRPSRIAHTTSDWPRRMSPAANTFGTEV